MSIKKSLRILLIITAIIPIVVISVMAHSWLTKRLIEVQTENLKSLAGTNIHGLEAMLLSQKAEVSLLSADGELKEYLKSGSIKASYPGDINIDDILKNKAENDVGPMMITLYDSSMKAIASSDPGLLESDAGDKETLLYMYRTNGMAVGVSGILHLNMDGMSTYAIEIGCPIIDDDSNNVLGYIVNTLFLSYFKNLLGSITVGESGYAVLIDRDGTILFHPDNSLIGSNINSQKLSGIINDYKNGLTGISGTFNYRHEGNNQAYGYSILPETDWVLLVKQDVSELVSLTSIILKLLLFISAILIIIIVISAHFLTKKITDPIISLRDAMRTASDGDLTVQTNIKSRNELGELSKSFNKMIHIIKTNYEDLASMHEELLSNEEQLRTNYDHIEYLAYHDTLTNLPNKLAFLDYVNAALVSSPTTKKTHAVYFVDLDNFKTVNDTLGHEFGDMLLIKTAQILTTLIGSNGMLARSGGDEFLIFREGIPSRDAAVSFASKILDSFREPLELDSELVYVSMSIGIAIYPDNGLSSNSLIKNADIAMYKSKDMGKNRFTLFDSRMEDELNRNTLIIDVLRNAVNNNDVYIQYQPLFCIQTKAVIGFEALMRMRSDKLGLLEPVEFIPIAEESGIICELSTWLIKESCRLNKKLIDNGVTPRPVSVNISSIQINRPDFTSIISDILKETGLPSKYLELEITESTLVSSITDTTALLHSLQNIGVRISLDDFGTGYSSLNYLTNMPINTLKIDKSFIDNITVSEKDAKIAQSIISLAHSLNIKVVAEGVERQEQFDLLRSMNCDYVQGFLLSYPLYPSELVDLIKRE